MICPRCQRQATQIGDFWVCGTHGQLPREPKPSSGESGTRKSESVFLSYGRKDARGFAERLARDLKKHGQSVWLDLESIESGADFDVRIERGIQSSRVVAAIMSPRSVEEDSVCRDEIVYAINENRQVVPIRIESDSNVKPTLLLARRNWVDFSERYETGLSALLRFLDGDEHALKAPLLSMVGGVSPIDFSVEIAKFTQNFVGRVWLRSEIDRWLENSKKRAFVVVAAPGLGKSAIAAALTRRSDVVALHFCIRQNTASLDPQQFVAALVAQLHARLPGYDAVLAVREPERRRSSASDAFRQLIVEPTTALPPPAAPFLIIVDSLDEADAWSRVGAGRDEASEGRPGQESVLDVIVQQAPDLPPWLRIIATTRPEDSVVKRLRTFDVLELMASRNENKLDLIDYISARVASGSVRDEPAAIRDLIINRVEELASGLFLYAKLVLDELEQGTLELDDLGQLMPELEDFYAVSFARRYADIAVYNTRIRPLLRAFVAARAPLPFSTIRGVIDESAETANQYLLELRAFLEANRDADDDCYQLFHKSIRDWLVNRQAAGEFWCDETEAEIQLAAACWKEYMAGVDGMSPYALRHLPAHLLNTGDWESLVSILLDLQYLERRTTAGQIFELVADFRRTSEALPKSHRTHRVVTLLSKALGRDVHFIARHAADYPQGLFQSLWNSCWWYDSVEAESYYEAEASTGLAAASAGENLSNLLERWRTEREAAAPGFIWLRAMRPPSVHLGTDQLAVLRGHGRSVTSVSADRDGSRIASSSDDNSVRIWNAETGDTHAVLQGHDQQVECVSFSHNQSAVVSGSWDNTVCVWDVEAKAARTVIEGHEGYVASVCFNPDDSRVVSGSWDKTVCVWDADTGERCSVLKGHDRGVTSVSMSSDGKRIASGSWDSTVRIWNAQTGRIELVLRGHEDSVTSVSFSPDSARIVSGSRDNTLRLWDVETGDLMACLRGHDRGVMSASFSPDGTRIISGSLDKTVRTWNATTGETQAIFRGHERGVNSVSFIGNGDRFASGSSDSTARVWDSEIGRQHAQLIGHEDSVRSMTISPDGARVATGSRDRTIRIWDARTGRTNEVLRGHSHEVTSASFGPDGTTIVSGSMDKTARVWTISRGEERVVFRRHQGEVWTVAGSPRGDRAASGSTDKSVRIWDTDSGHQYAALLGHEDSVRCVAYSPDGCFIVSGSLDRTVRVWDARTGSIQSVLVGHARGVMHVSISPDGTRIISRDLENSVIVWDVRSGQAIEQFDSDTDIVPDWSRPSHGVFVAATQDMDLVIRRRLHDTPIAWFAESPRRHFAALPDGRTWAGVSGSTHFQLIALEGSQRR
ncbi:MAG: TIR domain-containing protein [bacterium]|nr:TIR domain-containing protein [bacterium]